MSILVLLALLSRKWLAITVEAFRIILYGYTNIRQTFGKITNIENLPNDYSYPMNMMLE